MTKNIEVFGADLPRKRYESNFRLVGLRKDLHEALKKKAYSEGKSMSEVLGELVKEYVDESNLEREPQSES